MRPLPTLPLLGALCLAQGAEPTADMLQRFAPLPAVMEAKANPVTAAKTDLGRMLYYEPRLSKGQTISCNTCHLLDRYGVDGTPTSTGYNGMKGDRNAPTVYNAAGHLSQFWDGRAADVEEQAKGPVLNPVEMAMPGEAEVVAVLKSMPEYVAAFRRAFPNQSDPVTYTNFALAVGAFERKLVTPSRWDRYLNGDKTALSDAEKAGFIKFVETGCATCHAGAYVGGAMYQKLGLRKAWPDNSDPGRFRVTKNEADRMVFKVPSLRNIDKTAPYFHDGKVASLPQAVRLMAEYELGKVLTEADTGSIVTWLKALTGDLPLDYIRPPALPKSGPKTAKPVTLQ